MDIKERLSFESVSEHTLIACEHIHRYQVAAEVCGGLRVVDLACGIGYGSALLAETAAAVHGVDNDAATVDLAAATVGAQTIATFEAADAVEFLRREPDDQYDTIVCFEGLEHLERPDDALQRLTELAESGIRLLISIPNSRAFDEENEFHVTDFDYQQANDLLDRFPKALMLYQYLAEGSLVCAGDAQELDTYLVNIDRAEPEYANHFLLAAGFDASTMLRAHRSRVQLNHAPVYNAYMRNLERANQQLRYINNELSRKLMANAYGTAAKADSAAASLVSGLGDRLADLTEAAAQYEIELTRRDDELEHLRSELFEARKLLALQPGYAPADEQDEPSSRR